MYIGRYDGGGKLNNNNLSVQSYHGRGSELASAVSDISKNTHNAVS